MVFCKESFSKILVMSDATCTVGKDGKKYYFVNGKRTTKKATGKCTPSKAAEKSPKKVTPKKTITKKAAKVSKRAPAKPEQATPIVFGIDNGVRYSRKAPELKGKGDLIRVPGLTDEDMWRSPGKYYKIGEEIFLNKVPQKVIPKKTPKKAAKKTTKKVAKNQEKEIGGFDEKGVMEEEMVKMGMISESQLLKKSGTKPAKKTVAKKAAKKTVRASPKNQAPKAGVFNVKKPSGHQLFLFRETPVYKIEVGGKIRYIPNPPQKSFREKLIEELAPYPGEEIGVVSEVALMKDSLQELKTTKYFLLNPTDAKKVRENPTWQNSEGVDYAGNPHDIKVKNHLKYLWEYGDMTVYDQTYPTFIRPVRSYYKLNHIKNLPKVDETLVSTDYNTHRMMMTIAKERGSWSHNQWDTFTNNLIVNGYIMSNLHPVEK